MGTQQLLLIVLGIIIVGVAVFIAILLFKGNSQSANRDAITADLENLATIAQQYYRKPTTLAGGGYNYLGFNIIGLDTGNEDGSYSIAATQPSGPDYTPGNTDPINTSTQTIFLLGCGKEIGNDETNPVKIFMEVTQDSLSAYVLN
ncbi:MAG TPA: hypothetical protein VIS48_06815 [Candidatus Kryptonia bacterium]